MSKDKTRSIALDGDVAEIAQDLANKGLLSKTISQLLREKYGYVSEIEKAEALLFSLTSQRKAAQVEEEAALEHLEQLKKADDEATRILQAEAAEKAQKEATRRLNSIRNKELAMENLKKEVMVLAASLTDPDTLVKATQPLKNKISRLNLELAALRRAHDADGQ